MLALLVQTIKSGVNSRRSKVRFSQRRKSSIFAVRGLTSFRIYRMVFHMKTTLVIPDSLFRDLKRRAADRNETVSALVTEYLRQGLRHSRPARRPFRFPTFQMGHPKVNIADREALYDLLDAERDARLYGHARKRG